MTLNAPMLPATPAAPSDGRISALQRLSLDARRSYHHTRSNPSPNQSRTQNATFALRACSREEVLAMCREPTPWPWTKSVAEAVRRSDTRRLSVIAPPEGNVPGSAYLSVSRDMDGDGSRVMELQKTQCSAESSSSRCVWSANAIFQWSSIFAYSAATAAFSVRAYFLTGSKYGGVLACCWQCAFAFVYLLVGVILPFLSRYLILSGPATCVLDYRSLYSEEVTSGDGFLHIFISLSRILGPISSAVGLITPVTAVWEMMDLRHQGDDIFNGHMHESLAPIISSSCGLVGMLLFGDVCHELVYDASLASIRLFIHHLEDDSDKIDWASLAEEHHALTCMLTRLWAVDCFGGLYAGRITLLFGGCLVLMALGLKAAPWAWAYRIGAFMTAACGVSLLMRLARLTDLCTRSSQPHRDLNRSILSSTLQHVGMVDGCQCFSDFLQYLRCNPLEIRLLGIPVTYKLVADIASRFMFQIPLIIAMLSTLLHESRLHNSKEM